MATDQQIHEAFATRPLPHEYVDSFVAFVDVLGFTARVRALTADAEFEKLGLLVLALKLEAHSVSRREGALAGLAATFVSDSLIVSVPYSSEAAAFKFVVFLHDIQHNAAVLMGALMRGYVSRGRMFHRDGMLFGDGYLDAYEGEVRIKGPPRIVIASDVLHDARSQIAMAQQRMPSGAASIFDYLRQDSDGVYFIDYLKPVGTFGLRAPEERRSEIEAVLRLAEEGRDRFRGEPSIVRKYEWLCGYSSRAAKEIV